LASNSRFATAVHVLAVLGFLDESGVDRVSSGLLASSVGTHAVVIRSLLKSLKAAGLVRSTEGRGGGVSLSRPPSKISLRDVFQAVESETLLVPNGRPSNKLCPVSRNMKPIMLGIFGEVDEAVGLALKGKTLADVVREIAKRTMSENG
jgi:Rrf2 family protein